MSKNYKYKNITLLIISIFIAIFLFENQWFHDFLHSLKSFGYISAFIAGVFFVSTFTAAIGTVILLFLAENLNPFALAFISALGCVTGDLIIFKYIRSDGLNDEVKAIVGKKRLNRTLRLLHTPYFKWLTPMIGAILIAAPGPDELGISLLGISKLSTKNFILISFLLNLLSVSFILGLANILR